jgi:hypothetical protein
LPKIPLPALAPYESVVFYIFYREGAHGMYQPYNRNQVYSSLRGAQGAIKALDRYFSDAEYQFVVYPAITEVPLVVDWLELERKQEQLGVLRRKAVQNV